MFIFNGERCCWGVDWGCDLILMVLYYLSRKLTQYPVTDPDFSGFRLMLIVYMCIWLWMYSFPDQFASLLVQGYRGLTDVEVGRKDIYLCPGNHHRQLCGEESPNRRNDLGVRNRSYNQRESARIWCGVGQMLISDIWSRFLWSSRVFIHSTVTVISQWWLIGSWCWFVLLILAGVGQSCLTHCWV